MPSGLTNAIDLTRPPRIVAAGRNTHGDEPVERYRFDGVWCVHLYRYRFTLELDGEPHRVEPDTVSLVRPGVRMTYRFPRPGCRHHYCLFMLAPPYGPREPQDRVDVLPSATFPTFTAGPSLSPAFGSLFDRVADAPATRPGRATAALWEMLWQLTDDRHARDAAAGDPAEVAAAQIRTRLSERLRVADLAEEVGLSHNQLTRRFRARFGTTVVGYLQEQRMATAARMLRDTSLPMKVIATEIGLDAQQFNKAVRRAFGRSPTALRDRG
ncbi:MAG: AraC family transcriptional regulator [Planctomycetota bacterium]